jgi:hypothetical protein
MAPRPRLPDCSRVPRAKTRKSRPEGRLDSCRNRRRPTLPGRIRPSTIGATGLNFCVRNGNRCDPSAIATETVTPDPFGPVTGLAVSTLLGACEFSDVYSIVNFTQILRICCIDPSTGRPTWGFEIQTVLSLEDSIASTNTQKILSISKRNQALGRLVPVS